MIEHEFTEKIRNILQSHFGEASVAILESSELLQYLNIKTKSASAGSKSRGSFANHYALYVLVEDYLAGGFHEKGLTRITGRHIEVEISPDDDEIIISFPKGY